jgi:hypothetical protein
MEAIFVQQHIKSRTIVFLKFEILLLQATDNQITEREKKIGVGVSMTFFILVSWLIINSN